VLTAVTLQAMGYRNISTLGGVTVLDLDDHVGPGGVQSARSALTTRSPATAMSYAVVSGQS